MDEERRKIERMASEGDLDAARRLQILSMRMGGKFILNRPAGISWVAFLKQNRYKVLSYPPIDGQDSFYLSVKYGGNVVCIHKHSTIRAAWKCAKRHLYSETKKALLS